MFSRDHPPLQDWRAGSGMPGLAGLPSHPGGVAELDRTRRWRLLGRGQAADRAGASLERESVMTEQCVPDSYDQTAAPFRGPQASAVHFETLMPSPASIGLLARGVNSDSPRWQECSPEEAVLDTLGRCEARRTITVATLRQIRRDLARAWRLMLALEINEAFGAIERLELQLDDVPPPNARRLHGATQLLRAAGLAFQDDSQAVVPIALSVMKKGETIRDNRAAFTLTADNNGDLECE
jgi:hypothetical protein